MVAVARFLAVLALPWPAARAQAGIGTWTTGGPGVQTVQALAVDPATNSTVYAGALGFGVSKSVNGGGEWTPMSAGLADLNIGALAIDPGNPATLYAGTTASGGAFRSVDGGGQWGEINAGLTDTQVNALVAPAPGILYAGTPSGPFRSINGGGQWSGPLTTNLGLHTNIRALVTEPGNPSTVYAGEFSGGVYKSTNAGDSWSPMTSGLTSLEIRALAIHPSQAATLYAGTAGGVFKSTNGGGQWSPVNANLGNLDVRGLALDPSTPTTVYAATAGGVFRSINAGGTWSALNDGLTTLDIRSVTVDPSTAVVHAGTNQKGVFEFQEAGLTLAVAVAGSGAVTSTPGGIDCGPDCSEAYAIGTTVTLTPAPAADSVFDGFGGDADCLDGVVTLLHGPVACTAHFTRPVIVSPGSTVLLLEQGIDLVVVTRPGGRTVTGFGIAVNGVDVSGPFGACQVPGTLEDGSGTTARCGGLSGALLRDLFGPGPYAVEVTTAFDDGSQVIESVTWSLAASVPGSGLVLSPVADLLTTSQGFDFVLVVGPEGAGLTGGHATLDGHDVTAALTACVLAGGLPGGALTFRCPGLTGGTLGPGSHTVSVTLDLAGGTSLPAALTWEVLADTEP